MVNTKKVKIVFAPGSFDDFDGTQEELDGLIKAVTDFIESDDFQDALENAEEMDFDEIEDEEELFQTFNTMGNHTIH